MTDELGRSVALGAVPVRRVVCLAPSVTEILFALGAGDMLVGRDKFSDAPEAALAVPIVGSDLEPSHERILGLKPDVVFTATTANRQETAEDLERYGVPVFVTKTMSLADLRGTIVHVGAIVGKTPEAAKLVASIDEGLAKIRAEREKLPRVKTLIVVWNEPLMVVGPGSYTTEILEAAGGENVASDGSPGYPQYALERVLRAAPQVIVVGSHKDGGQVEDRVTFWTRYREIPAVRDGRVIPLDGDLLFRPGPRAVETARIVFDALYPKEKAKP
ncbi:MAG: cobalamin-binding protein [Acidobacteriota bacterium]